MPLKITDRQAQSDVDARHWRVVLGSLHATFRTGSFVSGVAFVRRVADVAELAGHHPDVDLRYGRVQVRLTTHEVGGLTTRDTALAAAITAIADEYSLPGEPGRSRGVEIAIDAMDIPAVEPFWRAVLAYDVEPPPADDASPALIDPDGIGPTLWFQQMDVPRPQRNRIHLDVSVAHDEAESRVAAAIAAGGHLVSAGRAPAFWVLADAEGNEACVCTWQGREPVPGSMDPGA